MMHSLSTFRNATACIALAFLAACSSKSSNPSPASTAGMSWTVDGNNITAITTRHNTTDSTVEVVGVYNTPASSTGVDIIIPKAVGTYAIPGSGARSVIAAYVVVGIGSNSNLNYSSFADAGTVTISSLTATNVIGTFSYSGPDLINTPPAATKAITNGKFNIAL